MVWASFGRNKPNNLGRVSLGNSRQYLSQLSIMCWASFGHFLLKLSTILAPAFPCRKPLSHSKIINSQHGASTCLSASYNLPVCTKKLPEEKIADWVQWRRHIHWRRPHSLVHQGTTTHHAISVALASAHANNSHKVSYILCACTAAPHLVLKHWTRKEFCMPSTSVSMVGMHLWTCCH